MRNEREKPTRTQGMGIVSIPLWGEGESSWREKILMEKKKEENHVGNAFSCILCQLGESGGKKWRQLRAKPAFSWILWCCWRVFWEKMDNSDGKRRIFLHCCCMVLDWDEGYTTKTKNTGEKPPNPAIFLDSTSLLEVFWGRKQEIPLEKATFFVVSDRDEGSAKKMKKTGKKPNKCGSFAGFRGGV